MYHQVVGFLGIVVLSAMAALAIIIGTAMRIGKDPAVDGPRALIAEFFGLWIAFAFLAWSFMTDGPAKMQWALRGMAAVSAVLGFVLAAWFAGTSEVRVKLDEEPTGVDHHIPALQLHEDGSLRTETNDTATIAK
jgi:hypothetical protein